MKDWASEVLVDESDELSADVAASAAHDVLLAVEDDEEATETDTGLERAANTVDDGKVKAAAAAGRARMGQAKNLIVPRFCSGKMRPSGLRMSTVGLESARSSGGVVEPWIDRMRRMCWPRKMLQ